ncbi:hypothetical protein LRP_1690 [Ligilactobacillus ruminis]|nr:hypothetical protein LRP_1690 [Ligilactobacillus ruminis]
MMKICSIMHGADFFFFWQRAKISLKFTDKEPIFADLSVNNSDFAKCSAVRQQLNRCT